MKQEEMMNNAHANERQQAAYLAAFTDALMDDEDMSEEGVDPTLAQTVQLLNRTLRAEPPPSRLRYRLQQAIRAPQPTKPVRWWQTLHHALLGSRQRRTWSAAGALAAMALIVTLVISYTDLEMVGTATGEPHALLWALGVGLLIAVVIAVLWWDASSR